MDEPPIKQWILDGINRLPDDCTLDDIVHLVRMHELLAQGRRDSAAGLGMTSDQLRERYGIPIERPS